MSEHTRSDIEKFFEAVALKFGVQRKFSELNPVEVQMLCQGVNIILQVIHD